MTSLKKWLPLLLLVAGCAVVVFLADMVSIFHRGEESPNAEAQTWQSTSAADWPVDLPPLEEFAQQLIDRASLPCCLVVPDPGLQPQDPRSTWIGKVVAGAPGETWPLYNGRPMVGICQLNLKEALYKPDDLQDLEFVALFMAAGTGNQPIDVPTDPAKDRAKWTIRAYRSVQELVPYSDAPAAPRGLRPCGARFKMFLDHPGRYEELYDIRDQRGLPDEWAALVEQEIDLIEESEGETRWRTKIGGWPAPVQDPILRPLAFQIGSEPAVGLNWVDSGCVYIWRTRPDLLTDWDLDIQFY